MKTTKKDLKKIIVFLVAYCLITTILALCVLCVTQFILNDSDNCASAETVVEANTETNSNSVWYVNDNVKYRIVDNNIFDVQIVERYYKTVRIMSTHTCVTDAGEIRRLTGAFYETPVDLSVSVVYSFTVDYNKNAVICKDGSIIDVREFKLPEDVYVYLEVELPENVIYAEGEIPSQREIEIQLNNVAVEETVRFSSSFYRTVNQSVKVNIMLDGQVYTVEKTN